MSCLSSYCYTWLIFDICIYLFIRQVFTELILCGRPCARFLGYTGEEDRCAPHLTQSVQAAITKCHKLEGLNNRTPFSHTSGDQKSETRAPALLGSAESILLPYRKRAHAGLLTVSSCGRGKERASSRVSLHARTLSPSGGPHSRGLI